MSPKSPSCTGGRGGDVVVVSHNVPGRQWPYVGVVVVRHASAGERRRGRPGTGQIVWL